MKLYYSPGACSLAVHIVINEIGLPAEYEKVDLQAKKTESGHDYFKINPKGSVPALEIEKGTVLTENAVIQQYLADTNKAYTLLPPAGDFNRYKVLMWLNYVATELHKGFSPLFNSAIPQEIKDQIFIPTIKKKFAYVDEQLKGHTYLLGEDFTLPDAYLFVILYWAAKMKIDISNLPNLTRYFAELGNRKSVQKTLKEEGLA